MEIAEKIEKKGSVESDKTLIGKVSPWHRIRIVVTYPIYILRYFTRACEVDADTKANDLEKGIILSSPFTVAGSDDEKTPEKAS